MNIAILCATRRGYLVLEEILERRTADHILVFSFREESHEPPFLDSIRRLAEQHGATFFETRNIARAMERPPLVGASLDLLIAVSWRYIIPMDIAATASRGCYILHDSLLPAYRGFSPTVWALINGESAVGATLFHAAQAVDSGDIVDQVRVEVGPDERIDTVMDRVTAAYVELIRRNLPDMVRGHAPRHPQDESQATYTCKRLPIDNAIDWASPTRQILNLIRAVGRPYPGAFTTCSGRKMIVWEAAPAENVGRYVGSVPGRVAAIEPGRGVVVLTGDGHVLVKRVQFENEYEVCATDAITSLSCTLGS